jgi:hypothetical protein
MRLIIALFPRRYESRHAGPRKLKPSPKGWQELPGKAREWICRDALEPSVTKHCSNDAAMPGRSGGYVALCHAIGKRAHKAYGVGLYELVHFYLWPDVDHEVVAQPLPVIFGRPIRTRVAHV